MNILIANATGPTNIGDQAMLEVLLEMIHASYPAAHITIHSTGPHLYKKSLANKIDHTLYNWTVFSSTKPLERFFRILDLILKYFLIALHLPHNFGSKKTNELIEDYKSAELIFFVGGGYLRSQKGVTQILNALMQLVMFEFAHLQKAKTIVCPISFGPFGYHFLEVLSAMTLKKVDVLSVREKISAKKLIHLGVHNIILSTDHALFLPKIPSHKNKTFTLGFTIRDWFQNEQQQIFENEFAEAIAQFAKKHTLTVQPIIQVDAPEHGDHDFEITKKVVKKLKTQGITVHPILKPKDLNSASQAYANLDMLVGMRMHSNILAINQNVPFVAIAYEYKTEGICGALGSSDLCIRCEDVTQETLLRLLEKTYVARDEIKTRLKKNLAVLVNKEKAKWIKMITNGSAPVSRLHKK